MEGIDFVMLRPDICEVAKELYWGNGRRPNPSDDLTIRLFTSMASQSDVMLDIGAYTGIFTIVSALANPNLVAHAFEVVPDVYKLLFDNCVRNDILHQVWLHHTGIGSPDRVATFPASSTGSALPSFYSTSLTFESGVRVRFESLDSLSGLIDPRGSVIVKVDVEGTENEVFEHGQRFLAEFKPDIVCEVLKDVADPDRLMKLLEPHGYDCYLIRDSGLSVQSRIEPNARFRDWLFTTRAPSDPLLAAR